MFTDKRFFRVLSILLLIVLIISVGSSCIRIAKEKLPDPKQLIPGEQATVPKGITGTIATGNKVELVSQNISASGGAITINKPGDPLDGMKIEVPTNAYKQTKTFKISAAPVTGHTFGEHFNPITPLITIENGGGYANELITIKIPAKVPAGHFAMGFFYDGKRNILEGIPLVAMDNTSLTLVTQHFSSLLISSIEQKLLDGEIDTGFKVGVDDWYMSNPTTIIIGGQCAAQSITMIWYYVEQPEGTGTHLYNRHDAYGTKHEPTPRLEYDDVLATKLVSSLQRDYEDNNIELEKKFRKATYVSPEVTWKLFCYSMLLTKRPQLLLLGDPKAERPGGHAVVAYKKSFLERAGDVIWVADPNNPGDVNQWVKYPLGNVCYGATTAIFDWDVLLKRWAEFKNGTVGNDRYPKYKLMVKDEQDKWVELKDGYNAKRDTIEIKGESLNSDAKITRIIVHKPGSRTSIGYWNPDSEIHEAKLEKGNNVLGISLWGKSGGAPGGLLTSSWAGFEYITIKYQDEECTTGWVLESVTPKITKYPDRDGYTGMELTTQEGSYKGKGNYTNQSTSTPFTASFSYSASWTPLPKCIKPNERKSIILSADLNFTISPASVQWGAIDNCVYIDRKNRQNLGRIKLSARTGSVPAPQTKTIDLLMEGTGWNPGAVEEIVVYFDTPSGSGEYLYKYVYRK